MFASFIGILTEKYLVPISWPQNGDIVFENVTMQHKMRSPTCQGPVLFDVNVKIPAGQKVFNQLNQRHPSTVNKSL